MSKVGVLLGVDSLEVAGLMWAFAGLVGEIP